MSQNLFLVPKGPPRPHPFEIRDGKAVAVPPDLLKQREADYWAARRTLGLPVEEPPSDETTIETPVVEGKHE